VSETFWIKDGVQESPIAVLEVGGRMGGSAAQEMLRRCQTLVDEGIQNLVINMENVSFIASSGAGALVVISEQFRRNGGSIQIASASAAVCRVIDLLNLHRFVTFATDEGSALDKFRAEQATRTP